ncbi:GAF domain-containing protein [Petrotoga sp. 9PWA.NaAc.5.4]|uniref:GAF domain-containing protein n=1 Tax=Petrotoga sp. 9PWA.NaAc.5.4 TaxID=1434328 RepID=UPI000CA72514|nr:GAF domain-containing protein [Petrotoga sp. 9PWA.NaAc.5.4]PNR96201.1 histidine kinase [Petrotoga sp. 9PWA.NaAc.5.4]
MRSVFRDFTDDFFEILTYPKENWEDFWKSYKKLFDFVDIYVKKTNLKDEDIVKKLKEIGRRDLDKAFWYKQEIIRNLKSDIIEDLTKYSEKFQLNRGDFAVYLSVFLGDKPYLFLDSFKGTIIVVDILYLYFNKDKINPRKIIEEAITTFINFTSPNKKKADFWILYDKIKTIITDKNYKDRNQVLKIICELLAERIPYYNWVGFYLVDEKEKDSLTLGPFVGEPTEHTKIKFGQGICGQAASTKTTFIVDDVSKEDNYLSCSPKTQSEIVVPIFDKKGKIVGEIDIDSHNKASFDSDDHNFLEAIAKLLTERFW